MRFGRRWMVLVLLVMPAAVGADPGIEVARGDADFVRWYLYAESPGLVLGEGALGVLLEDPGGGVRLAPHLELEIRAPDGSTQTRVARPGFADNLLIQGAPVFFHETGRWTLQARTLAPARARVFDVRLEVREGSGVWRRAWPWLILPVLVLWGVWQTKRRPAQRRHPQST